MRHHQAARQLVEAKGFSYKEASALVEQPVEELLTRVEAVTRLKGRPNVHEARAMFEMVAAPALKVSGALTVVDWSCPCALVERSELVTEVIARLVVEAVPMTVSPPLIVEEA